MVLILLAACLINTELYKERMDAVTDDDGDGLNDDQGDCDDADPASFPGAAEVCDGRDNDCDGGIDDGDFQAETCDGLDNDCNGSIDEGIAEVEACDGIDNNCDGAIDEGLATTWYLDGDGDGYGNDARTAEDCEEPSGHVAQGGDCDDGDTAANPAAAEVCDGIDNDCDADTDEGLSTSTWYLDGDGDGYGTGSATESCEVPSGAVDNGDDCDDDDSEAFPGAVESIDGRDEDCSGTVDDLDADTDAVVFVATTADGRAGSSVLWADLDADGRDDLVFGAPGREKGADPCAVHSLGGTDLESGDFSLASTLVSDSYIRCGAAMVWLADDAELVVSSPEEEGGWIDVYGSDMTVRASWWRAGVENVGSSLGAPGDFDGDGTADLAVGAPSGSIDLSLAGAVYIVPLDASSGEIEDGSIADLRGDLAGGHVGEAVASGSDVDGDGYVDVAVGAPDYGDGGRAWLFLGGASPEFELGVAAATLSGDAGDNLGTALALDPSGAWWAGAPGGSRVLGLAGGRTGTHDTGSVDDLLVGVAGEEAGAALVAEDGGLWVASPAATGNSGRVDWYDPPSAPPTATILGMTGGELGRGIAPAAEWLAMGAPRYESSDAGAVVLARRR